jgi:hypothetical protein
MSESRNGAGQVGIAKDYHKANAIATHERILNTIRIPIPSDC